METARIQIIGLMKENMFILENKLRNLIRAMERPLYICVNGVLVPAVKLPEVLQQYCHNLIHFAVSEDDLDPKNYESLPRFSGSVTGLSYRNKKFIVCTAHQIWRDEEDELISPRIGFKEEVGMGYIGSNSLSYYSLEDPSKESNLPTHDVCVFDFSKQVIDHPKVSHKFFNLSSEKFLNNGDDVIMYLICGYISSDTDYKIDDSDGTIRNVNVILKYTQVWCKPVFEDIYYSLGKCMQIHNCNFDPDGFSGAPVFSIVIENYQPKIKFAGIVTKFNVWQEKNRMIHFVKANVVRELLDYAANKY